MAFLDVFNFSRRSVANCEIPNIYPMSFQFNDFVISDIVNIYSKILIDCVERTQGITDAVMPCLWDNCLQSESNKGLVTLLAEAMANKRDLFLVYNLGVLREATREEQDKIREEYKEKAESKTGIFVSFKNYNKTDMLKIYSGMEYAVLNSLNKSMNLSKSIQFKMGKMRESVGATDSQDIIDQAKSIASGLACGNDVIIDAEDEIKTATPEMESTENAIAFLDAKRSFYLNLPLCYITGEKTGGIGSTGEADSKDVEQGLKHYYISILRPVILALFKLKTTFKSHDFRQINSGFEGLKTFELTPDDLLTRDEKRLIICKLFDIEYKALPNDGRSGEQDFTPGSNSRPTKDEGQ